MHRHSKVHVPQDLEEGHIGERLLHVLTGKHQVAGAGLELPGALERGHCFRRERHGMRPPHFHARGGDSPQSGLQIELRPSHASNLARTRSRQDKRF